MNSENILLTVLLGVAVNEIWDIPRWAAHKLVRWSAHVRYDDPARAGSRAQELAKLIDDVPTNLLKFIVALSFVAAALAGTGDRSSVPMAVIPSYVPEALTLDLKFAPYRPEDSVIWLHRSRRMQGDWNRLELDVNKAVAVLGRRYRFGTCGRKLQRLAKATGDAGWMTVECNAARLYEVLSSLERANTAAFEGQTFAGGGGRMLPLPIPNTTPTEPQAAAFCNAVRRCRA